MLKQGMSYLAAVLGVLMGIGIVSYADETVREKAKYKVNKVSDGMRETGRDLKDATCTAFNSKGECVMKEAKHKVKNARDRIETEAENVKDKVD